MGYIISVSNQKGGVGKTTTAVNLAASVAVLGKRSLLVDCDPQGNATTGIGVDKSILKSGIYDFMLGSLPKEEVISVTMMPGVSLIGSTKNMIGAEVEIYREEEREYLLKKRLLSVRNEYDYIFLDCPPSMGFLTLNAITAADFVLVPLQCEYYALEGLSGLLKTLKAVKRGLNPALKLIGILLTMCDSRNNLSSQVEEEVRSHFKETVFHTIIPRNVRLSEAPSYGKPAILYDEKSKGALSYLSLARELLRRGEKNVQT